MKLNLQSSKFKVQIKKLLLLSVFLLITIYCSLFAAAFAAEKWPGVDESVVEKYAKEHGREAREPFINTDQGDLLLFVFLLAGTIGGFAAGYYWRILMAEKAPKTKREDKKITG
ncbi:MAG: cobalt transporter [Nitrospirae bacterium]|nr:cobalt transporter [Nitrospirota bacterium]